MDRRARPRLFRGRLAQDGAGPLKGGSLDALVSKTSDGIALTPLYGRGAATSRATRGAAGPWAVLARVDHPEAGDANAQAREDLTGGADGLQVVFAGAAGAYGYGLGQWDSAYRHRAFDDVRFDEGAEFQLDLGPRRRGSGYGLRWAYRALWSQNRGRSSQLRPRSDRRLGPQWTRVALGR